MTTEQRQAALVHANEVRIQRSRLRRRLHELGRGSGPAEAKRVLVEEAEQYASMTIGEFLLMVPGVGPQRARRLLSQLEISPWRSVRDLSQGRRIALADVLAAQGRRP